MDKKTLVKIFSYVTSALFALVCVISIKGLAVGDSSMDPVPMIFLSLVGSVVFFLFPDIRAKNEEKRLKELSDFNELDMPPEEEAKYIKMFGNRFAINEQDKKIILNKDVFDWQSIKGAEILEDEKIVQTSHSAGTSKTKKAPGIGGALVGGALFGVPGALIGGLGGGKSKTRSRGEIVASDTNYCMNLKLRVNLSIISNPCVYVEFITAEKVDKHGKDYKAISESCERCFFVIQEIINTIGVNGSV